MENIGSDWLADRVSNMTEGIMHVTPVEYNEDNRYLPPGVSPRPGFIRYDLFPYMREILNCFDPLSPVREVNLLKGVQVGSTTAIIEAILLYYIGHIKSQGAMFLTADGDLAKIRIENNILPMVNESDLGHLIRSSDEGNFRKTGKTKNFLQWEGGGSLIYNGALNAAKMRQTSVPLMLKDELDGWQRSVGKDGNSDSLTDARLSAYWPVRKIYRGSTPLLVPSMMTEAYERGDQRKYLILCKKCSFPQELKQEHINKETGEISGFKWETEEGRLIIDSVRYCCLDCGHEHFEHDKEFIFAEENGAYWHPTAVPKEEGIRSYHLPAWYSPFRFRPWSKGIADYLDCFDPTTKKVTSISKYQEYYNNTLGRPFAVMGSKIRFSNVSSHRRAIYRLGEIPNKYACQHSGSNILFLTCQVDVHKRNLAVSVKGWTRDMRCYVIDYWRFERENEDDDCAEITSPVWGRLQELIEEKIYKADDGKKYGIMLTLIDAGYANDTVCTFCSTYDSGVYPILGRDRPGKNQTIKEFSEFTTQQGTVGYKITVDHYKDRLAPVLRRSWTEEMGEQKKYHFNAPVDISDKQLKELTKEIRRKKVDEKGNTTYEWYRPGNAANELWDLFGYGHAAVEIFAWSICIQHFELDNIDWPVFWDFAEAEENRDLFVRLA